MIGYATTIAYIFK